MEWPQIVMIVMLSISASLNLLGLSIERTRYGSIGGLLSSAFMVFLLIQGGFFK